MQSRPLIKYSTDIIFHVTSDFTITNFLPNNSKPFGSESATIIDKKVTSFFDEQQKKNLVKDLTSFKSSTKRKLQIESQLLTVTQQQQWFLLTIKKINTKFDQGFVISATNINSLKLLEEKLRLELIEKDNQTEALQNANQINNIILSGVADKNDAEILLHKSEHHFRP